ncbi:hypothetical protein [Altererythrobacter fulvus]
MVGDKAGILIAMDMAERFRPSGELTGGSLANLARRGKGSLVQNSMPLA